MGLRLTWTAADAGAKELIGKEPNSMLALVLALLAPAQCGPGGCAPGGGGLPQMFFLPQIPNYEQLLYTPPPVVTAQPPITSGFADGKIHRVEIEHADGSRWWYTFSPPQEVSVKLDASNHNAAVGIEFNKGRKQVPSTKPAKPCSNADCSCEDCKCKPCNCGPAKTVAAAVQEDDIPNFGIDLQKMRAASKEFEYSINGKRCTKQQAFDAVAGDGITDDSGHLRLSCIGTPEECKPIEHDVANNPAFKGLGFTFQSYKSDDPMIKDIGVQPGKPAVYLQNPDGKVLARWESYAGADKVAGEIRKRDPNYDPNKDPRPDKPSPILPSVPNIDLSKLPGWVWAALALAFMFFTKQPAPKV